MSDRTILNLNKLNSTSISGSDMFLVTDISDKETKNIVASEFVNHLINKTNTFLTNSFTGSFFGNLIGTTDTSSYTLQSDTSKSSSFLIFNGDINGTASLSITSSNTMFSISASLADTSSYSISSSVSDITLYAATTSSTKALQSDSSSYALKSGTSSTSSFINYYGQDNGTVLSSSFSERSLRSLVATSVVNADSAVVYKSISSSFSTQAVTSSFVETSSYSTYAETALSATKRILSAINFNVSVSDSGSITVTPVSWKNVSNITTDHPSISTENYSNDRADAPFAAAGTDSQPYSISFYVKFKNHPYYSNPQVDLSALNTTVISSWHLTQNNLPTWTNSASDEQPPAFYVSAFPCGIDGYIIKILIYNIFYTSSVGGVNPYKFSYWKTLLDGSSISAIVYGNSQDLLSFGPPDSLPQQRISGSSYTPTANTTLVTNSVAIENFPFFPSESYNNVVSIASNVADNFNLLLLQNGNTKTDRKIAKLSGYGITGSVYNPFPNNTIQNILYDGNNTDGNNSRYVMVLPYTASYIDKTTFTSSNNPSWNISPFNFNQTYLKSVAHLTSSSYVLITTQSISFSSSNVYSGSLPIYTIPNITSNATPVITGSTFGISASLSPRIVTSCSLNSVVGISGSNSAVAVGTNGVVLYTNNSGIHWYRVDYLSTGSTSPLITYTSSVNNLNSVAYDTLNKLVFVGGSTTTNRSVLLFCAIPISPLDTTASNWNWSSSYFSNRTGSGLANDSIFSVYINNSNPSFAQLVSAGSASVADEKPNILYNLYYTPDASSRGNLNTINSAPIYNSIGIVNQNQYLFGGYNTITIYSQVSM